MVLQRSADGVRLASLVDLATDQEFLTPDPLPLFTLTLRHVENHEEVRIHADGGWDKVGIRPLDSTQGAEIHWRAPRDKRFNGIEVIARVTMDGEVGAARWKLRVENTNQQWSVWRLVFPQIALAELGPEADVFLPRAPGEVQRGLWRREFECGDTYPGAWMTMQFMAAYDRQLDTGLYVAVHDPLGGTKDLLIESRPTDRAVVFHFDHPATDMGKPGNRFQLSGEAVWQLFRGDWYDAAMLYRDWVHQQAKWYPDAAHRGRADTPKWMRELPVWVRADWTPSNLEDVEQFAKFMGVPVGLHCYTWHQVPFDNDYPHYFPAKEGFVETVARLQAAGVYVMPYINARLWDTRDKGAEDFEFSRLALPAAIKNDDGEPRVETYGSTESDGSKVRMAVMCPSAGVWQDRMRDIVLRLVDEYGANAVFVDQVAASKAVLCFDRAHGHPLGGGHWWTQGYWHMLDSIRDAMPEDSALTTECNAEPYVKWFDGYLTWHWQHQGQVPAFPAICGGALQMFGRAYRSGATKDLAMRMKAGQQLVFGEQLGWIAPHIVKYEKENARFLRQLVRLRWRLRRYFYAGRMGRPPQLLGEIPKVRADWRWRKEWWVTTDAAMAGAWYLPEEGKAVLLFVNVSDQPVDTSLDLDAGPYGVAGDQVRVTTIAPEGEGGSIVLPRVSRPELNLQPHTAMAWELAQP